MFFGAVLRKVVVSRSRQIAGFESVDLGANHALQYLQLFKSAPGGAVFSMRSKIFGRYMVL
jgi:hypothetical protein